MSKKPCWIDEDGIIRALEEFFQWVDAETAKAYYDDPGMTEQQLMGFFRARIADHREIEHTQRRINALRAEAGKLPVSLHIDARSIDYAERTHGADLGLVVSLDLPGEHSVKKAGILQAKRLYPDDGFHTECTYDELFKENSGSIPPQWERMLAVTPASYYLLLNPDSVMVKKARRPRTEQTGLRVCEAGVVQGDAQAGIRHWSYRDGARKSGAFARWMVEDLVCCNAGDIAEQAVRTASGKNRDFTISHTVEISISMPEGSKALLR